MECVVYELGAGEEVDGGEVEEDDFEEFWDGEDFF